MSVLPKQIKPFWIPVITFVLLLGSTVFAGDEKSDSCEEASAQIGTHTKSFKLVGGKEAKIRFKWEDQTTRKLSREDWVVEAFRDVQVIFPYFLLPLNFEVVMTAKKTGLASRNRYKVTIADLKDEDAFQSVFFHELGHIVFKILLHRSGFKESPVESEKRLYQGVEEFFSDLFTVLLTKDKNSIQKCCNQLVVDDPTQSDFTKFSRKWNKLRSFDYQVTLPYFRRRVYALAGEGHKVFKASDSDRKFTAVHGYLGWLRGRVGANWDKIIKDRTQFLKRFLFVASYWDATNRKKRKEALITRIIQTNLFFAVQLEID